MPWGDWSCKELAEVLGCEPTKATQAVGPALAKIALLMLVNPRKTWAAIDEAMSLITHQDKTSFAARKWADRYDELTDRNGGENRLIKLDSHRTR